MGKPDELQLILGSSDYVVQCKPAVLQAMLKDCSMYHAPVGVPQHVPSDGTCEITSHKHNPCKACRGRDMGPTKRLRLEFTWNVQYLCITTPTVQKVKGIRMVS